MRPWLRTSVLLAAWCSACTDSGETQFRGAPDAAGGVEEDAGARPYDPETTPAPRYVNGAMLARGGGGFGLIAWARATGDGGIYVGGTMERTVTVLSTVSGAQQEIGAEYGYFLLRLRGSLGAEWSLGFGSSAQADFRRFRSPAVLPDGSVVLLRQSSVALHQHALSRVSPAGTIEWSVTPPDVGYAALAATSTGDVLSLGGHSTDSDLDPGPDTQNPAAAGVHIARFDGTSGALEQMELMEDAGFHEPGSIAMTGADFPVFSVMNDTGATGWLVRLDAELSRSAPGTWVQSFHRRTDVWSLRGDDAVWALNAAVEPVGDAPPGPPSLIDQSTGQVTSTPPLPLVTEVWGAAPAGNDVMIRGDYYQPDAPHLRTKLPVGSFVAALAPEGGFRWFRSVQGRASIVNEFLAVGDRLYVFGNATLQTGERIDLDPTDGVDEFVADVTDRYLYVLEFEVP